MSIDRKATAILTEHLGYPPLTIIDDIINAVNHILYKCTQAMETYLKERQAEQRQPVHDNVWLKLTDDEINVGTGKLETLLEHQIDKNFDKFELYSLRNIFHIPQELIDGGYIRLDHHEGIFNHDDINDGDQQIKQLVENIKYELKIRQLLNHQLTKGKQLVHQLTEFHRSIQFLNDDNASPERDIIINKLSPIDDNLKFILNQTHTLVTEILDLHHKISTHQLNFKFQPTNRDVYLNSKLLKVLEKLGVLNDSEELNFDEITQGDLNNLKSLSET